MRPTRSELRAIDPNGIMHMHRCDVPLDDAPSEQPPVRGQRGDSQPGWRSNLNCSNDAQCQCDTIFIWQGQAQGQVKFKLRRGRRVRRQERNGSSEHRSVRGCRHAVLRKFRLRLCSCVCGVRVVVRVARESSRKLEPLSRFKATSSREMAVKA